MPSSVAAPPRLVVCTVDRALSCVLTEYVAAGWFVQRALRVDTSPWQRGAGRLVCTGSLTGVHQLGDVAELLSRGLSVAVLVEELGLAAQVYDQCRRLAVAEWFDESDRPPSDGLDSSQVALLLRIRDGDDVEAAAHSCHLSARTAARRLATARSALGSRTTAEAAARLGARIDELRR